jgi:protein gp37
MGKTKIEWTDAVWNPVTGCTKVSAGCKFCYAERDFHRPYPGRDFTDVRTHPDRLLQPLRWRRPRRIFVDSMGDLFHEDVPPQFIDQCFAVMALADRHTFQVLTKRPERMRNYFNLAYVTGLDLPSICAEARIERCAETIARMRGPKMEDAYWKRLLTQPYQNVWLGVSIEDQATADERVPLLLQTRAAVRFVSYEPALGPVSLTRFFTGNASQCERCGGIYESGKMDPRACPKCYGLPTFQKPHGIDWIIAGGESGPNARPSHPDWFRSVRDQCQAAGVPFFFKQWGEWYPTPMRNVVMPSDAGKLLPFTVACSTVRREAGKTVYHAYPSTLQDGIGTFEHLDRIPKKLSNRLLDGREWNEFPKLKIDN